MTEVINPLPAIPNELKGPVDEDGNSTGLWIPLIGSHYNEWLVPLEDRAEPSPSSIILVDGKWGTAWQRHHGDGLWHSTGHAKPRTWAWLVNNKRNIVLVYDADERTV